MVVLNSRLVHSTTALGVFATSANMHAQIGYTALRLALSPSLKRARSGRPERRNTLPNTRSYAQSSRDCMYELFLMEYYPDLRRAFNL